MIDKSSLKAMKKEIEAFDEQREALIKSSRDVLRFSKQAISNIHRDDIKEAEKLIEYVEKVLTRCKAMIKKDNRLVNVGAYMASLEEYSEAKLFLGFVKGKIPTAAQLKVPSDQYLLGLCDFTGELARMAVVSAIKGNDKKVQKIRDIVDEIFTYFSSLDLRNSELRKKADSIKWNLKKSEEVLYDLKITKTHK